MTERTNPTSGDDLDDAIDESFDEAAVDAELEETNDVLSPLRTTLSSLLEPKAGLEQRTYDAVRKTLHGRDSMMTVASLFNLGWRTPKVILMDSENPDDS